MSKTVRIQGELLKAARQLRNEAEPGQYTQEAVADAAQCGVRWLQNAENGTQPVRMDVLEKVCHHLGLDLEEVLLPDKVYPKQVRRVQTVDFRTLHSARSGADWKNSRLAISPLSLAFGLDRHAVEPVHLIQLQLCLPDLEPSEVFTGTWMVALNPGGQGWLGIKDDFREAEIAPGGRWVDDVMFVSNTPFSTTWQEFVNTIKHSTLTEFRLLLSATFDSVTIRDLEFVVSVRQIQERMKLAFGNEFGFPQMVQVPTLGGDGHE